MVIFCIPSEVHFFYSHFCIIYKVEREIWLIKAIVSFVYMYMNNTVHYWWNAFHHFCATSAFCVLCFSPRYNCSGSWIRPHLHCILFGNSKPLLGPHAQHSIHSYMVTLWYLTTCLQLISGKVLMIQSKDCIVIKARSLDSNLILWRLTW
jgi:hypothetical protein